MRQPLPETSTQKAVAFLFVPGNRPERYAKAVASGAHAVIIDLEDAVAPADKLHARSSLASAPLPGGAASLVRVNAIGTPWHAEDIEAAVRLPIDGIMLPKAEQSEAHNALAARLPEQMALLLLIETAKGLSQARALASQPRALRLAFGSWDFCADLGLAHTREATSAARAELAMASRLAGLTAPIDGVSTAIDDEASVEADAAYAREMGFGGKLTIHPRQVAPVLRGFAPSPAEVAWARKILAVQSDGAVAVGGMMVDAPVRLRAARILALAQDRVAPAACA